MQNRSRLLAVALAAFVDSNAIAAQPACYGDVRSFMAARFGPAFEDDENLIVKEQKYGNQTFTLAVDQTSVTNVTRILLRKTPQGEYCVVLTTPPMAQLHVVETDTAGDPIQFRASDQAPGTQPGHEITYALGKSNTYLPVRCNTVAFKATGVVRKPVSCSAIAHHD